MQLFQLLCPYEKIGIKLLEKSISHPQAKQRDYNRLHQANQKRKERDLDSKEKKQSPGGVL